MNHAKSRSRLATLAGLSACLLALVAGPTRAQGSAAAAPSAIPEQTRYKMYFQRAMLLEQSDAKAATETQAQVEQLDSTGDTKKADAARAKLERIQKGGWWEHVQAAAHLSDQETEIVHRIVDDYIQTFSQQDAQTAAAIARSRADRHNAELKAQAKAQWDQGQEILTSHIQQLHAELGDDAFSRFDAFVTDSVQGGSNGTTRLAPTSGSRPQP
jgi:hypothetical protein